MTSAKIRFNQPAFLIGRLCSPYISKISSLEVIITWCKSDIQCDNNNMKWSSNPFLLWFSKEERWSRKYLMLCDKKAPSLCRFLKLHVAMANKNESSLTCFNIQINIAKSSDIFFMKVAVHVYTNKDSRIVFAIFSGTFCKITNETKTNKPTTTTNKQTKIYNFLGNLDNLFPQQTN